MLAGVGRETAIVHEDRILPDRGDQKVQSGGRVMGTGRHLVDISSYYILEPVGQPVSQHTVLVPYNQQLHSGDCDRSSHLFSFFAFPLPLIYAAAKTFY